MTALKLSVFAAALVGLLLGTASSALARAEECANLSYRRNAIYKEAGYCFKTAAQIQIFGNAGCRYDEVDEVPLSANDRAEVSAIVSEERAYGCR